MRCEDILTSLSCTMDGEVCLVSSMCPETGGQGEDGGSPHVVMDVVQ